jgi:pyruvate dehydrogenase E2 component (dihydrolipoamide acetyltransferase)
MTRFAEVRNCSSAKIPLVLLHGFGGIGALWAPIISRLDPDIPLIVYDLPGHGQSLDADGVGHAGVMARAILGDLDRRGISRFHLCGHSMGGAVASLIALKTAARVPSLTLLAPGGFGFEIDQEALRRYGSAVDEEALSAALAAMMAPDRRPDRAGLDRLAQARGRAGATEWLNTILQSFLVKREERTGQIMGQGTLPLAALADIGVPTRLFWGREDQILPVMQAKNAWQGADVVLIDGVGHMLIDEAPDLVASALATALADE